MSQIICECQNESILTDIFCSICGNKIRNKFFESKIFEFYNNNDESLNELNDCLNGGWEVKGYVIQRVQGGSTNFYSILLVREQIYTMER